MNEKQAFCTILDDDHTYGFCVLLTSLLIENPWFNLDFIIFEFGRGLSQVSKEQIKNIYPKTSYKKINTRHYDGCSFVGTRQWSRATPTQKKIKSAAFALNKSYELGVQGAEEYNAAYRFEIFTLKGYESIIYIDADMVVVGDISGLVQNNDFKFAGCPLEHPRNPFKRKPKGYNGGLLKISSQYLDSGETQEGQETKGALIKLCSGDKHEFKGNQPVINEYFFDRAGSGLLDSCYNAQTEQICSQEILDHAKILHFVGASKPWSPASIKDPGTPANEMRNFFSQWQIQMVGTYMCLELLKKWTKYAKMVK